MNDSGQTNNNNGKNAEKKDGEDDDFSDKIANELAKSAYKFEDTSSEEAAEHKHESSP